MLRKYLHKIKNDGITIQRRLGTNWLDIETCINTEDAKERLSHINDGFMVFHSHSLHKSIEVFMEMCYVEKPVISTTEFQGFTVVEIKVAGKQLTINYNYADEAKEDIVALEKYRLRIMDFNNSDFGKKLKTIINETTDRDY